MIRPRIPFRSLVARSLLASSLLISGLSLLDARPAHAGPWTKQRLGEVYVKLGQGFFLSDSYVDNTGRTVDGTDYLGATTSLYLEAGLLKGLHLQAYLPYVLASNTFEDGVSFVQAGGGDAVFGLQYTPPLSIGGLVHALRAEVKVPLYDVAEPKGSLASRFPAFGDGQLDVTLWLSVGGGLSSVPIYGFAELGYRFRTEAYVGDGDSRELGDSVVFASQLGYTLPFRAVPAIIAVNAGGVIALVDDALTKSYVTVGPSAYVPLWRGLAAEASFDPVVYANNSAKGVGFSFGLSYKR